MGISRRRHGRRPGIGRQLALAMVVAGGLVASARPVRAADDDDGHGDHDSQFTVGQYVEVSARTVSGKDVEYTFLAYVTNHGLAAHDVLCRVHVDDDHGRDDDHSVPMGLTGDGHAYTGHDDDDDDGIVLLDDTLGFGTVGAKARVRSVDTFTFRQERGLRI